MTITNDSEELATGFEVPSNTELRGRGLRFLLVDELMKWPQATVKELVAMLDARGFRLAGRASKIVSDALRWEVARGRVARLGRGVYRYVSAPPTTARRIRVFATRCLAWVTAINHNQPPPPTPPDLRAAPHRQYCLPHTPPWENLSWLWTR